MINAQLIKTTLIRILGERSTAFIQGLRFVYLLYTSRNIDPEIALLPKLLKKNDTAVDVGANGANWTYWLHRAVGRHGLVFAFEADPYYALATEFTVRFLRLKGVKLFPFGLSDSDEVVPLRLTDSHGLRLAGLSHIDRNADKDGGDVKLIRLRSLDSLTLENPRLLTTTLIKCDVEGYELFVFRGASKVLEQARPIVILETGNFESQGYSGKELKEFFARQDYDCYAMTGENTLERTDAAMEHDKALTVNRILFPREKLLEIKNGIRLLG